MDSQCRRLWNGLPWRLVTWSWADRIQIHFLALHGAKIPRHTIESMRVIVSTCCWILVSRVGGRDIASGLRRRRDAAQNCE